MYKSCIVNIQMNATHSCWSVPGSTSLLHLISAPHSCSTAPSIHLSNNRTHSRAHYNCHHKLYIIYYIMFVYSLLDHGMTILFQEQQQQRQYYRHLVTVMKIDVDNYLKINSNICREPLGEWRFRHWAVVPVVLSPGHVQCHRWGARWGLTCTLTISAPKCGGNLCLFLVCSTYVGLAGGEVS